MGFYVSLVFFVCGKKTEEESGGKGERGKGKGERGKGKGEKVNIPYFQRRCQRRARPVSCTPPNGSSGSLEQKCLVRKKVSRQWRVGSGDPMDSQ